MILIPQYRTARRAATAGAFNPLDDAGLMLWIDPSTLSTLWQDTGASTAVAADADPVDLAQDRSSNARNLVGAGSTARPLYKTSGGLSWLDFDGSNDYLYRTSAFAYAAGACSIFIGYYSASTSPNTFIITEGSTSTTTPVYCPAIASNSVGAELGAFYRTDGNYTVINSATEMGVINNSTAHVVSITDSGSSFKTYVDGTLDTTTAYTRATTTLNSFSLGALRRTSVSFYRACRIYQLLIVNRVVSDSDRALYQQFVASKCGVTL